MYNKSIFPYYEEETSFHRIVPRTIALQAQSVTRGSSGIPRRRMNTESNLIAKSEAAVVTERASVFVSSGDEYSNASVPPVA